MSAAQSLQAAHTSTSGSTSPDPVTASTSALPSLVSTPTSSAATTATEPPTPATSLSQSTSSLDFDSESAFPTLGASAATNSGWKGKKPAGLWSTAGSAASKLAQANGKSNGAAVAAPSSAPRPPPTPTFTDTLTLPSVSIAVQQPRPQPGRGSNVPPPPTSLGEVLTLVMKSIPGVRIEASTSQKNSTTTFLFRGPTEGAVRKAYKEVVQRAVKKSSIIVEVPSSTRPFIIGAGGRMLKQIIESTSTQIQLPPREESGAATPLPEAAEDGDEPLIPLTITGDPEGCEQARARIMAIVGERAVKATRKLTTADIPREFWPLLNGVQGAHLREILAAVGLEEGAVQANVPGRKALRNSDGTVASSSASTGEVGEEDGAEQRAREADIVLVGSRENVDRAAEAIMAEYAELKRVSRSLTISLPKRQHRFLIGQHADDILGATGSSVSVPFQDDPSENVLILGRLEATTAALGLVMQKAATAHVDIVDLATAHREPKHDAIQYAQDISRYLLRRGKLRTVQDDNNVQIFVPRPTAIAGGNTSIEVVGEREAVDIARKVVASIVKELPPYAFATVEVDSLLHKHLIGKKGQRIKAFEDGKGVQVIFPGQNEDRNEVLLVQATQLPIAEAKAALQEVTAAIQQLAKETADIKSSSVTVPAKLHGAIVGQNGTTLNAIIGEERAVIVRCGDGGEDVISIRGPSKEVERVEKEILRVAEEAKNNEVVNSYTAEFDMEPKLVSHIVGRGGSGVNKLRDDLGVRVDFNEVVEGKRKKAHVVIKGRRENVEEAKKRILSQAEKIADEVTLMIPMPSGMDRGTLIGKQGSYVQRLETKYEVKVNFPKSARATNGDDASSDRSSTAPDSISIRGPKKGAEAAKKELIELIEYEKEHSNTAHMEVSTRSISRIFGRSGAALRELGDETGANIDVGRSEGPTVPITLRGTKTAIAEAKKRLQAISREVEDETVVELSIDRGLHVALIGKGGQNIRDMVAKCGGPSDGRAQGNIVRFPRQGDDGDTVTLRGPKDLVAKLQVELEKAAAILRDRVIYAVAIPAGTHAVIIGRGGAGVAEVTRKHDVKVLFPGRNEYTNVGEASNAADVATDDPADIVKLSGTESACKAAAEELKSRSAAQQVRGQSSKPSRSVPIPRHLHARVAEGGRLAKQARDLNVRIDHGGVKAPTVAPMPPRPKRPTTNGTASSSSARIDMDASHDDDAEDDSIDIFIWDVVELGDESKSTGSADVPWNLSGAEEAVATIAGIIEERLQSARNATHGAYLQVAGSSMPRLVGRGGFGLERLRGSGSTVEVLGKRDADTLVFSGTLEQLEAVKETARQMCLRR